LTRGLGFDHQLELLVSGLRKKFFLSRRRHGSSRLTRSRALRLNPPPEATQACLAAATSIVAPCWGPTSRLQRPGSRALRAPRSRQGIEASGQTWPDFASTRSLLRRLLASRFVPGVCTADPALHSPELAAGRTVDYCCALPAGSSPWEREEDIARKNGAENEAAAARGDGGHGDAGQYLQGLRAPPGSPLP